MTECGIRYKNLAAGEWRQCVKPAGHRGSCDGPAESAGIPQWQKDRYAVLLDACQGLHVSAAERRTLLWLAQWEPITVENIAAVIERAKAVTP